MNIRNEKMILILSIVFVGVLMAGCEAERKSDYFSDMFETKVELGTTIGSLVEVFSIDKIPVESYALVGGLKGTGSLQCPPQIRTYLEKYILRQMPDYKNINKLIESKNTAVVKVEGYAPASDSQSSNFDLKVTVLAGTQTTSLVGGSLYEAELRQRGTFFFGTRVLATGAGPMFIDKSVSGKVDERSGYVLGGGKSASKYKIFLSLRKPDYKVSNLIRNRLCERFGGDAATALSDDKIELHVPEKYAQQKRRFVAIVKATYITDNPEVTAERIKKYIRKLATAPEKNEAATALEAIGNASLGKLAILLNSSNEKVRFYAGRCMLNLGSDKGLDSLRQIAMDKESALRVDALEAIRLSARRNDAAAISRLLLRDTDFSIRLAAYESLRKLNDISISRRFVGGKFYLEQIAQTHYKGVFVARSGRPRVVLFGVPIECRENIFVQSEDGNITINAPAGQGYVSIIRKIPFRRDIPPIKVKSSFDLGDIIRRLCEEPLDKDYPGLNVSYSEILEILRLMCEKGAVQAEFRVGPLPKFW